MSHIAKIEMKVKNLDSLSKASRNLNGELRIDQKSYKWFGNFMNDYPLPQGVDKEDLGKCDHAINFKNANYEVGVVKSKEGYELRWDFWSSGGLTNIIGKDGGKLKQQYALEETKRAAMLKGLSTKETKEIKEGNRTKTRIEIYVK